MVPHNSLPNPISEAELVANVLSTKFNEEIIAIVLFGSATREMDPRDIDILVILKKDYPPKEKYRLRLSFYKALPFTYKDVELYVMNNSYARKLSPLHLGIALDARILYDPTNLAYKIIDATKKLMKEWGTVRRILKDGTWVILPKGHVISEGVIEYGQILV